MLDCLCFGWRRRKYEKQVHHGFDFKCDSPRTSYVDLEAPEVKKPEIESKPNPSIICKDSSFNDRTKVFNYRELATATRNFHPDSFLGEGGFGSVYKGKLLGSDEVVAVKKLNPLGLQGEKEFLVEVLMLSLLCHPNLVNMIGYCAEGTQRLLVLEYMPLGSLEDHLHDLPPGKKPLDWNTRMKIAAGAAKGIDYLHNEAKPPVIFRDLKPSNILLNDDFHPKLSDFGLAKFGPVGDDSHVSTRVMGTHGYCAPEYALTGRLTAKTDTYSFGVVLLELVTGRGALFRDEEIGRSVCLVDWARPLLKDRKDHLQLVDPQLKGRFPKSALHKALEVAEMCLRENAHARPTMQEVATAMEYLTSLKYERHSRSSLSLESLPLDGNAQTQESLLMDSKAREAAKISNYNFERELAIAEAKMWGEKWREKRQQQRIDCSPDSICR